VSYQCDVILIRTEVVWISAENPFDASNKAEELLNDYPGYIISQFDLAPTREEVVEEY